MTSKETVVIVLVVIVNLIISEVMLFAMWPSLEYAVSQTTNNIDMLLAVTPLLERMIPIELLATAALLTVFGIGSD